MLVDDALLFFCSFEIILLAVVLLVIRASAGSRVYYATILLVWYTLLGSATMVLGLIG